MAVSPDFPKAFSPDALRRRYPDLSTLDDETLAAHYEAYGRTEGRVSSDAALRADFVKLIDPSSYLLEIGPYFSPVFDGPNVEYLDVFDADDLRSRAASAGFDTSRVPQTIHYTHGLDQCAGKNFDAVFSSHSIEHQPDLVRHLQAVAAALAPGGSYWIIVPDKRYCFDHHLPETSLFDVLGAYLERRTHHTAKAVLSHLVLTDHNDAIAHWQGSHGDSEKIDLVHTRQAMKYYEDNSKEYIDTHAWQFTPLLFTKILNALSILELSPFSQIQVQDTPFGTFEFTAVLTKGD